MTVSKINEIGRGYKLGILEYVQQQKIIDSEVRMVFLRDKVFSIIIFCSAIYEGLPTCRLKCLYRVLRMAVRLEGRIPRFGRVSGYMRDNVPSKLCACARAHML